MILQEYFFLQVRKITYPVSSYGRENLTFKNINEGLDRSGLMTEEILSLSSKIHLYREIVSNLSNRVIAHADKATTLSAGLIGEHSDTELENFMSNMQAYTNAVGIALGVGPLDYSSQAGPGDVLDLIRSLKRA
ncbi:hypothetical protein D3C84_986890 [compost metagenome]